MTNTAAPKTEIVEKIRKLLAMAKGGTEHEAALAAARAAELMAKHRIDEASIRLTAGTEAEPIADEKMGGSTKRVAWQGSIASGLCAAFGAKMYWSGGDIMVYGRRSTVETVRYMLEYLTRAVNQLADRGWTAHGPATDNARTWKNAFRLGAASTISQRLREQRRAEEIDRVEHRAKVRDEQVEAPSSCTALQVIDLVEQDEQEVEASYAERSAKFRSARAIGSTRSHSGWTAGGLAGRGVRLATGGARGLGAPSKQVRG